MISLLYSFRNLAAKVHFSFEKAKKYRKRLNGQRGRDPVAGDTIIMMNRTKWRRTNYPSSALKMTVKCGKAPLIPLPEATGEEDKDGHDLETADEHEEGTKPLQTVTELGPRHLRAYIGVETGTNITDEAERDGDGVGNVDARHNHDNGGDEEHEHVEGEEGKEGDQTTLWHTLTAYPDGEHGIGMKDVVELVA